MIWSKYVEARKMPTQSEDLAGKKPYATPELTVHGTVEEITQYSGGLPRDAQQGSGPA